MVENINSAEISEESKIIRGVLVSKLKNLGKKHFQLDFDQPETSSDIYTQISKFFSISAKEFPHEIFIDYKNAAIFWSFESSLVKYLHKKFTPLYKKLDRMDDQKNLTELYNRWVFSTSSEERKFLASLIIRIIERNDKLNILNRFLYSVIFSFQETVFNPKKSITILEEVRKTLLNVKLEKKYEDEISYLIPIFESFYYLKLDDIKFASNKIAEAMAVNPKGINAKFYTLITDCTQISEEDLRKALYEILIYDLDRIQFAIETNNFGLFRLFLENNVFKKLFFFEELSPYSGEIESLLDELSLDYTERFNLFMDTFDDLTKIESEVFEDPKIKLIFDFLNKVYKNDFGRNNVLFKGSLLNLHKKFNSLIHEIEQYYVKQNQSIITDGLEIYRYNMAKLQDKHDKLKVDYDSKVERLKKQNELNLSSVQDEYKLHISNLEKRLDNLDFGNNYDPMNSFKNMFTYSLVGAAAVFLIAGFASFSNAGNINEVNPTIADFVIPGVKWGFVAFVIGMLSASGSAISTWFERANHKKRMVKRLESVKKQKEEKIASVAKSNKEEEEFLKNYFNEQVKQYEMNKDKLNNDMRETEKELSEEAAANVALNFSPFQRLVIK